MASQRIGCIYPLMNRSPDTTPSPLPSPLALASHDTPLLLDLATATPAQAGLIGGKASQLAAARAAGFPVPGGYVVTTAAFRLFLDHAGLQPPAAVADAPLDEELLGRLRERVLAASLPPALEQALAERHRAQFGEDGAVAVRSSGSFEDLEGASFAGQYETLLDVRGLAALQTALRRCWASLFTPRVLGYASKQAGGAAELLLAVLVQELVPAEVSGVLFTVNPVTGREEETLVEAVYGLGETLVAGRGGADRYVVDSETGALLRQELADKQRWLVPGRAASRTGEEPASPSGTHEEALPPELASRPTLQADQLRQLAALGQDLQVHFGLPLDVEWALSQGQLQLLQARPITSLSFAPELGEWTTADFKDGGVSSDVCPPFMASLYETAFEGSMPRYLKDIKLLPEEDTTPYYRVFFARPYWHVGKTKEVLTKVPGYNERHFDRDLGIAGDYEGDGITTPVTLRGLVRAIPILLALRRGYRRQLAIDRVFLATYDEKKRPFELPDEELRGLPDEDFRSRYRSLITGLYPETEITYFTTIYNTSNAMLDYKVQQEKAVKAAAGRLDPLALVGGLEDLAHLRPVKDLYETLKALHRAGRPVDDATVAAYARRWRHKSRKELDLRVPRWDEDLPHVRELLEQGLAAFASSRDPEETTRSQHQAYRQQRALALQALRWRPLARRAFAKNLEQIRTFAWWREELRDRSSYTYALVRRWTLEAGRRLVLAGVLQDREEVWFVRWSELLAHLAGELSAAALAEQVRRGQRRLRSFRNFDNPNEIGRGHRFRGPAGPPPATGSLLLQGTGACHGTVTGRARVLRSLDDAGRVQQGDILVTVFTDPGWTPVMALASGIVTETGGVLCHAAVISREYGIPAVLAVPGATTQIRDGDLLTLDGSHGTVTIAPRS